MHIDEPDEVGGSQVGQSEGTNDLLERQVRKEQPSRPDATKLRLKLANVQEYRVDAKEPSFGSRMPEQHTANKT